LEGRSILTISSRKAPSQETRPKQACQHYWYVHFNTHAQALCVT
jgi:hypothetical protein